MQLLIANIKTYAYIALYYMRYIDMRLLIKSNWKPNLLSRNQSDVSTSKLIRTFIIITYIGKLRLRKKLCFVQIQMLSNAVYALYANRVLYVHNWFCNCEAGVHNNSRKSLYMCAFAYVCTHTVQSMYSEYAGFSF